MSLQNTIFCDSFKTLFQEPELFTANFVYYGSEEVKKDALFYNGRNHFNSVLRGFLRLLFKG